MNEDSFDPAVVALLREIAADPRSTLLRIPRERLIRWVGRPGELLAPSGSLLTRAEKHLVSAYRDEAAWVLLQACVLELKKQPLVFSTLKPDPLLLTQSARRLARKGGMPEIQAAGQCLLQGPQLDAVRLAATALKLAPSDFGRNCLGVAFDRADQPDEALRQLKRLLQGGPSHSQRAQALENMAQVHSRAGGFSIALELSSRAAQVNPSKVRYTVWCFTYALQLGERESVERFGSAMQSHPDSGQVEEITRSIVAARNGGFWSPTRASQEAVADLRSGLPPCARRVSDAFI